MNTKILNYLCCQPNEFPINGTVSFEESVNNTKFLMCDHDIYFTFEAITPEPNGWSGFSLEYHCGDIRNKPWVCYDIQLLIKQFVQGYNSSKTPFKIFENLLAFLKEAQNNKATITICLD
jgi:hypothetical protein